MLLGILLVCLSGGYFTVHAHRRGHDGSGQGSIPRYLCPYENPDTHECFDLVTRNTTCIVTLVNGCDPNYKQICILDVTFERKTCTVYMCSNKGCCDGYTKINDGECIPGKTTEDLQCENGATKTPDGRCLCSDHFDGKCCENPVCDGDCLNGGRCELVNGEHVCVCPSSMYSGKHCEQVSCADSCQNGGKCIMDGVLTRCQCEYGYQGDRCQYPVNAKCQTKAFQGTLQCGETKNECESDLDCLNHAEGAVCCYSGCRALCMKPEPNQCFYDKLVYNAGETFSSDPCKKCVCQMSGSVSCTEIQCPPRHCPDGHEPIPVDGHCCKVCPGENITDTEAPTFSNCPEHFTVLNVDKQTGIARLPNLNLKAMDIFGTQLRISYSQEIFYHSHNADVQTNIHIVTAYSDCDLNGRRAECNFKVIVRDIYPPVFESCPTEFYAVQDDVITWEEPSVSDNIGLSSIKVDGDQFKDKTLGVGTYPVSYTAYDYDQNQAICAFLIRVFDENTKDSFGARETHGWTYRAVPLGLIVSVCICLVITIILLVCYCKFRKIRNQQGPSSATNSDIFAIYDTATDANGNAYENAKFPHLPEYSLPSAPPSYDQINQYDIVGEVTKEAPPIYEEIPNRTLDSSHQYENTNTDIGRGVENHTYVNEENKMEFMKI